MRAAFENVMMVHSALGRMDARWKLGAIVIAAAAAATVQGPWGAIWIALEATVLACFSGVPGSWLARRLAQALLLLLPFVVLLPFFVHGSAAPFRVGPVIVYPDGLRAALVICAKGVAIVLFLLALVGTTPIHVTFQAAQTLRVPGLLVQLSLLTHRYLLVAVREFGQLRTALRVRGYRNRATRHSYRTIGHVTGTLLLRSSERAERVGHAMRCRGFDGRYRTLCSFRTRPADVACFLTIAGVAWIAFLLPR